MVNRGPFQVDRHGLIFSDTVGLFVLNLFRYFGNSNVKRGSDSPRASRSLPCQPCIQPFAMKK